jgi:NitT/TauT family transport system permease protein
VTADVTTLPGGRRRGGRRRSGRAENSSSLLVVWTGRIAVLVIFLAGWQWVPQIDWMKKQSSVFDPFFVSSPSLIAHETWHLMIASHNQPSVWPYIWNTLQSTLEGVAIGTAAGALLGLVFSNNETIRRIADPYLATLNATPRIALIPIFVILFGTTTTTSVVTAIMLVLFIVYYNAYAGGRSVSAQTIQNAQLLGATRFEIMRRIRLPYVLAWVFAVIPNAISFGLVGVVTAELLTGSEGMGRLLSQSIGLSDSTLTFSVVIMLSIIGVAMVMTLDMIQRRLLHWWHNSQ